MTVDLAKEYNTAGLTGLWTLAGSLVPNPGTVNRAGLYQLVANNSFACADTAAITVVINGNPTVKITDPPPVCAPSTTNLTSAAVTAGSTTGLSYTYWTDAGATIPLPNASAASRGLYFIKGSDVNGCADTKVVNVVVYSLPTVFAGRDTTICDQGFAILRGSSANLSGGSVRYLWSPATGLSRADTANTVANPGGTLTYTLTATVDYGPCTLTATDAVIVTMRPPVPLFAGNDTIATIGVPHQLRATGAQNYLWSPAAPLNNPMGATPMATLLQDTRFIVTGTDFAGCSRSDTMLVRVFQGTTYYLPNAFSPNGDGLNDVFKPIPANIQSIDWFRIYNRYGYLLFETTKWLDGWDGTFRGIKQPVGNYVWVLKATARNGKKIEMKGNVVLVR
jgi:gliding motility-associated-like protein